MMTWTLTFTTISPLGHTVVDVATGTGAAECRAKERWARDWFRNHGFILVSIHLSVEVG